MKLEKDRGFVDVPFKFAPDIMHVGLHRTGTSYCQQILFPLLSADVKYFARSEVKLRGSSYSQRPTIDSKYQTISEGE